MGNCWGSIAGESKSATAPATPAPAPIAAASPPSPDPAPSIIGHLSEGDDSFLGSNASGNSRWSVATTNITSLILQASDAIGAFWLNNVADDNEFPAAVDDQALPDLGTATSGSNLRAFTYAQLKAATFNFRRSMVLGKGGFGMVYKGWLMEKLPFEGPKKRAIGIKKLGSSSMQGLRQWQAEVGFLRRLSHPNIIKLLGYCREDEELLIVYEFMEKGSLNYHLFGRGSRKVLPWEIRLKVAVGMARGLSYLHMMDKPIIYRDFKTSNILLDESYNAKISDFGLAKWGPTGGDQSITGRVMGTDGYAAPEYINTGLLYVKSDVYSFGVVLAEILTGLRAIDKNRPTQQLDLVKWAKPLLSSKRKLKGIMDSRLEGKYAIKEAMVVAHLALRCVQDEPKRRPSMKEVVETLEKLEARHKTD